jgi:hypothetical protein
MPNSVCSLVGVVPMPTIEKRLSVVPPPPPPASVDLFRSVRLVFSLDDTVQKPAAVVSLQDRARPESAAASIPQFGPPAITRVECTRCRCKMDPGFVRTVDVDLALSSKQWREQLRQDGEAHFRRQFFRRPLWLLGHFVFQKESAGSASHNVLDRPIVARDRRFC